MRFNHLKAAFVIMILTTSGITSAGITVGNLTLKNAGDTYITDTVNNVDYMRWDQQLNLTFAQITAATVNTENDLYGWSIASNLQANNFTDALLANISGGSQCSVLGTAVCGDATNSHGNEAIKELLGVNYTTSSSMYALFSNQGPGKDLGRLHYKHDGVVVKLNNNTDIFENGDKWATGQHGSNRVMSYMLVRDNVSGTSSVSTPSSFAILALGMLGLVSRRFKNLRRYG
jgi:hypothetical protein